MIQLVLSIGSNLDRDKHVSYAIKQLCKHFGELQISPVYEARAVGFEGPDFYNLVVAADTELTFDEARRKLQEIEVGAGRIRGKKTFSSRNLDIDVLLYGDENLKPQNINVPRDEIEHAAYVLRPLADLLPHKKHPILGISYAQMWQAFEDKNQPLKQSKTRFSCADESHH